MALQNYKLTLQYDGSRYRGWQRLGGGENTVQAKLEAVLSQLCGAPVEVHGSGRTDAGVHALGQVANFKTSAALTAPQIHEYLRAYLPQDISVTDVQVAPPLFHARLNATAKTYLYRIWNSPDPNPFLRKYSMQVPQPLDVAAMRAAATAFLGEHDFTAFSNAKGKKKSMVRKIDAFTLQQDGPLLTLRVRGNGFLYNMVRKMVGALLQVGLGQLTAQGIAQLLANGKRGGVTILADACGLYLERVEYGKPPAGHPAPKT